VISSRPYPVKVRHRAIQVSPCGRSNMRIKGWMGRADA
jgi:hypothetical protein